MSVKHWFNISLHQCLTLYWFYWVYSM